MNYYNEIDKKAAAWLRELIKAGLIPPGDVDERSITEVLPDDLTKYTQCHFFAGVSGWSLALQYAGWPATRPVGTGSCPCQPFSAAGKQLGSADSRHLWPAFFNLIRECRNRGQQWAFHVIGEQVANAIGKGWLDGISADLEAEGYACGAIVLGAHSVGAPNIRQRLYWVALASGARSARSEDARATGDSATEGRMLEPERNSSSRRLACTDGGKPGDGELQRGGEHGQQPQDGCPRRLVNGEFPGLEGYAWNEPVRRESGWVITRKARSVAAAGPACLPPAGNCLSTAGGFWDAFDIALCTDGKARRIEPGSFPLVNGVSGRVGLLRGYGNAINPVLAAEFIKAVMEELA